LTRSSVRTRLLAWYALAVVAILPTFAALAVWSVWKSTIRDLDGRLGAIAAGLGQAVQRDSSGRYEVNLAEPAFAAFSIPDDPPFYGIWSGERTLIDRSDASVDDAFPGSPTARTRDGRREVIVRGEHGATILVGRSLDSAYAMAWTVTAALAGAGGAALILACIGGWVLIVQALRPIGRIAQIAEAMSESNLGLRIDVSTDDELGRVAAALNRAFDRLQSAFERQARFTADASHELRTPLSSQISELEWALARQRSAAEYEASLGVCMRAATRMRAVVEGLLTLARADAGAEPLRRDPVDLLDIANEAAAGLRSLAEARDVQIRVEGLRTIVSGDGDRLRELVSNLMSNAIQYGRTGGTVVCSISQADHRAELSVTDDGPGIGAEDLPHIFERFYRANKARSRAVGGTGLGLAICKWIVEDHGGRIGCESAVDRGTRMIVTLPAGEAAPDAASPARATPVTEYDRRQA
jgi:heavy metal sensor kinase